MRWIVGDVLDVSVAGVDFLYLYRPGRPEGPGLGFYRRVARELGQAERSTVIFSIADCLFQELSGRFERFYFDGHLSCMRRRD